MNSFKPDELKASHALYKGGYSTVSFSKDSIFRDFINRSKVNLTIPVDAPLPPQLNMEQRRGRYAEREGPAFMDNPQPVEINRQRSPSPPRIEQPVVPAFPVVPRKIDQNNRDRIKDNINCMLALVDADDDSNDHLPETQQFFENRNRQTSNESMAKFWQLIKNLSEFYQKNGTINGQLSAKDIEILCNYFDICWSLLAYKSDLYGFVGKDQKIQKIAIGNIILAGEQAFYDCYSNGLRIFTANYEFSEDEIIEEDTYNYTKRAERVDAALEGNQNTALGFFKAIDQYFDTADL